MPVECGAGAAPPRARSGDGAKETIFDKEIKNLEAATKSKYEELKLSRLREKRRMWVDLGFGEPAEKKAKRSPRARRNVANPVVVAVRRSSRTADRGVGAEAAGGEGAAVSTTELQESMGSGEVREVLSRPVAPWHPGCGVGVG